MGSVSVKVGDEIEYGTDVGSVQTGDKQTKTRYYIKPGESNASVITIPSKTVKDVLSPLKPLPDKDKKEDAQRNMAWFALFGMLLYPFAVVLAA